MLLVKILPFLITQCTAGGLSVALTTQLQSPGALAPVLGCYVHSSYLNKASNEPANRSRTNNETLRTAPIRAKFAVLAPHLPKTELISLSVTLRRTRSSSSSSHRHNTVVMRKKQPREPTEPCYECVSSRSCKPLAPPAKPPVQPPSLPNTIVLRAKPRRCRRPKTGASSFCPTHAHNYGRRHHHQLR